MQKLIAIGYWNDGSDGCSLHNPQELTDPCGDTSLREQMYHYLCSGRSVAEYLGNSWCRFACDVGEREMGSAEHSDGVYLWPAALAHYVACHEIRLPDEFIEHARANGFRSSQPIFEDDAEGDFRFWLEWCAAHTNGNFEAHQLWRRTQEKLIRRSGDH